MRRRSKWNHGDLFYRLVADGWRGGLGMPPESAKKLTLWQANFLIEQMSREGKKNKVGESTADRAGRTDPAKLEEAREYQRRNREYYDPASKAVTGGSSGRVSLVEAKRLREAARAAKTSEIA